MSRFLVLNFQDYSLGHRITDTIQSHTLICMCCLQSSVPLLNIFSCEHSKFLENFSIPEPWAYKGAVCGHCHAMLKKIELFRQQVTESLEILQANAFNTDEKQNVRKVKLEVKKTVNVFLRPSPLSLKLTLKTDKKVQEPSVRIQENSVRSLAKSCEQGKGASKANELAVRESIIILPKSSRTSNERCIGINKKETVAELTVQKKEEVNVTIQENHVKNLADLSKDKTARVLPQLNRSLLKSNNRKSNEQSNYIYKNCVRSLVTKLNKQSNEDEDRLTAGVEVNPVRSMTELSQGKIGIHKNFTTGLHTSSSQAKLGIKAKESTVKLVNSVGADKVHKSKGGVRYVQAKRYLREKKDCTVLQDSAQKIDLQPTLRIVAKDNLRPTYKIMPKNKDTRSSFPVYRIMAKNKMKTKKLKHADMSTNNQMEATDNISENEDMEQDFALTEIKSETHNQFDDDITISETDLY